MASERAEDNQVVNIFKTTGPVANFFETMEPVKKTAENITLPERIPAIVQNADDSRELFAVAHASWVANLDRAKVREAVTRLRTIIPESEWNLIVTYLGEVRRAGVLAGGAWTNFGADHPNAPNEHRKFMRALGEARDAVRFKEAALVPAALDRLEQALEVYPDPAKIFTKFQPANKQSFDWFFEKKLHVLRSALEKPEASVRELHDARKDGSRQLINLYMLAAIRGGDADAQRVYLWLWRIDKDLGKLNDQVVRGEIGEDAIVTVRPEWRRLLREYLEKMEL